MATCPRCDGTGQVLVCRVLSGDYRLFRWSCLGCRGTGQVSDADRVRLQGELACAAADLGGEVQRVLKRLKSDDRVKRGDRVEIVAGVFQPPAYTNYQRTRGEKSGEDE